MSYHSIFVLKDGTVKGCGINNIGQLGDGTTEAKSTPITIPGLMNVKQVSCRYNNTFFLLEDGTLKSCGYDIYGILGDGSTTNKLTPVTATGLSNVKQISAGLYHTVFLLNDGTVKACGNNAAGQLGDGTYSDKVTPITVPVSNVKQISAGENHTVFLLDDGTVKSCGDNKYGQIGDGTTTNKYTPTTIPGLLNVKQISVGECYTVFLLNDGTVKSCGWNPFGQLGDGTTTTRLTPVTVPGLTNVKQISAGREHTVFLLNDGTVKGCGHSTFGQIGDRTVDNKLTPDTIPGISNVKQVFAGDQYTLFLLNDGTVKACGVNNYGQLGDGTTTDRYTPINIPSLSHVVALPELFAEASETTTKYLVLSSDGTAMKYGSDWVPVAQNWESLTEDQKLTYFQSDGLNDIPAQTALVSLGKFKIVRYCSDSTSTTPNLNLNTVPNDKLILANGDIDISSFSTMKQINPVCNVAGNGVVKIILSVDSGTTWKAWNGTQWVAVQATTTDVKSNGMLPSTLAAMATADLTSLLGSATKLRIGYLLAMDSSSDTANSDELNIIGVQKGYWEHAIPGQDFTSRFLDNETLQVSIKTNTSEFPGGKTDFKINHPM